MTGAVGAPLPTGRAHVARLAAALSSFDAEHVDRWGRLLARAFTAGHRLLVCGNGGSAAEAQHLTAELVGRFRDDRVALPAIALHADTSSVTAIGNDYGYDQVFARQVRAHGRPGDVLLVLSTSGRSPNAIEAVRAARECGVTSWALTGPVPNPLAALADDTVGVDADTTATVQEVHLVAVHLLCARVDVELGVAPAAAAAPVPVPAAPGRIDSQLDLDGAVVVVP